LWNTKNNFNLKQSISGYLYKTAYYTFIDNYRKHKQETKMLDGLAYKKKMELVYEDIDLKEDRLKKISDAIDELPIKCQEIADTLNISIKTVEAQIAKNR
tara:strand:- start:2833 stop:3132 length:300 start_codon:yes stop_codon:yes gene_type:complete